MPDTKKTKNYFINITALNLAITLFVAFFFQAGVAGYNRILLIFFFFPVMKKFKMDN